MGGHSGKISLPITYTTFTSSPRIINIITACNGSWGKVMFLHVSVIQVHGGSAPGPGTSNPQTRHPPGDQAPPWDQTAPWTRHPPNAVHAERYWQQAGGTHPTGMQSCVIQIYFFKNFVHFWGHWYPCFGFLVTSPLGFKARVGSALFELYGGVRDICCLRFTSGSVYSQHSCWSLFPHVCFNRGRMPDLNHRSPAWQADALTTRPQRPSV